MTGTKCARCGKLVGWRTVRHRCRTGIQRSKVVEIQHSKTKQLSYYQSLRRYWRETDVGER